MNQQDYPLALTAKHVAQIMGVNLHKAYEFTRRKDFPAIRDGNRIIIPRDAFFNWFNSCGGKFEIPTDSDFLEPIGDAQ